MIPIITGKSTTPENAFMSVHNTQALTTENVRLLKQWKLAQASMS